LRQHDDHAAGDRPVRAVRAADRRGVFLAPAAAPVRHPRLRPGTHDDPEFAAGGDGDLAAAHGAPDDDLDRPAVPLPPGRQHAGLDELRAVVAPDRPVERHVSPGLLLPRHGTREPPVRAPPGVRGSSPCPWSRVRIMPDLLDPADPRRGDRALSAVPARPQVPGLQAHAPGLQPGASGPPLLLFEQVSKWYGPVLGVNQVTLELRPGITGLVGANGAGKSTLLRLATGQLRPDLGRVRVRGLDAWSAPAKRCIGYCPDVDAFYEDLSGRQFVQTMARLF